MHSALTAMLTDTVQHAVATGQGDYGQPLAGPPVARAARIEYKVRRIVNAQGQEVISRCRVFVDGTTPVGIQDTVVLEDGTAPKIQLVYCVKDVDGSAHHYEVML